MRGFYENFSPFLSSLPSLSKKKSFRKPVAPILILSSSGERSWTVKNLYTVYIYTVQCLASRSHHGQILSCDCQLKRRYSWTAVEMPYASDCDWSRQAALKKLALNQCECTPWSLYVYHDFCRLATSSYWTLKRKCYRCAIKTAREVRCRASTVITETQKVEQKAKNVNSTLITTVSLLWASNSLIFWSRSHNRKAEV